MREIYSSNSNQITIAPETKSGNRVDIVYNGKEHQATLINFYYFHDGSWAANVSVPRQGIARLLGPKILRLRG